MFLIPLPHSSSVESVVWSVLPTSLHRESFEVDVRPVGANGLATESLARKSRFVEEAAVAQEESVAVRSACEVKAMAAAAGCVDRESSFRTLMPVSVDIADPDIAVERSASDVTIRW